MKPPLLDIHNATVYRGSTCVFEGLTLRIEDGCHAAILGPNGSGKTTLLKLMTRELYPAPIDGSSVRLFGEDQWNVWELRSTLGIVSADLQSEYAPSATGLEVVLSGFKASIGTWPHQTFTRAEQERAAEVLTELGVGALADRPYGTLSTGQQRRLLLGRALVHRPSTLLLDEPTNGLDIPSSFHYFDAVRALIHQGVTVLLATHHLHEIPTEIDRVIMLKEGRIAADGPRASVLTSESLSRLYGVPITLVEHNGIFQAFPAGGKGLEAASSRGERPSPRRRTR